jgi:hypothetical protein
MAGTARVIVNEIDKTQRVSGTSTASVGGVIPSVRGPVVPAFVTNNNQFYNAYTPTGIFQPGYDTSYIEIENYLKTASSLYLNRAYSSTCTYAGLTIYDTRSPNLNAAIQYSLIDPNNFVFTTNNGRALIPNSPFTIDNINGFLDVNRRFIHGY